MSAKHFQLLVVKALWEEDFRDLLFSRPEEAMKDFDLTQEERAELQRMERERFEDLVVDYRLRLTKEALKEEKMHINLNVVGDGVEAMRYLRKEGKFVKATRPDLILLDLILL